MTATDRQLLIGAHAGDQASARALWENHAPRLSVYAATILRNRADADDAVQHALCRVLTLPPARVREVQEVGAFLARVVRGVALNMLRGARRERRRVEAARPPAPHPPGVTRLHDLDESLARAIESLPRRLAEVVVLKHIAGLTLDQVAVALGQNRNTVAARHRVAIQRLREVLSDPDRDPDPDADSSSRSRPVPLPAGHHVSPDPARPSNPAFPARSGVVPRPPPPELQTDRLPASVPVPARP